MVVVVAAAVVVVTTPVVVVAASVVVVAASVVVVAASVVVVTSSVVVVASSVVVVTASVVVVAASVVVLVPGVLVVVVVEHGVDGGWQRSVIVLRDCPAFAWILQVPACVPCFFVFTLTPAKFPHTEVVPLALTLSFPIPPQWPLAWIRFLLRSFGVQLPPDWLTHSSSWNVHLLPAAVAQTALPSVTGALVWSLNSVAHWPCARLACGARARNAVAHASTIRRPS